MNRLASRNKISSISAFFLLLSLLPGCTNTRYPDLMRVTAECDVVIAKQHAIYAGSGSLAPRIAAREQIISLREKQKIMAERIDVKTIPEVATNKMTTAEGEAMKSDIVKAATARYNEAAALPVPVAASQQPLQGK